jgi:hypothetical protein
MTAHLTPFRHLRGLALAGVIGTLSACGGGGGGASGGGGGGDGNPVGSPTATDTVPLSAVANGPAYQDYVAGLASIRAVESAEPVSMGGPWDAPQSDTDEPLAL